MLLRPGRPPGADHRRSGPRPQPQRGFGYAAFGRVAPGQILTEPGTRPPHPPRRGARVPVRPTGRRVKPGGEGRKTGRRATPIRTPSSVQSTAGRRSPAQGTPTAAGLRLRHPRPVGARHRGAGRDPDAADGHADRGRDGAGADPERPGPHPPRPPADQRLPVRPAGSGPAGGGPQGGRGPKSATGGDCFCRIRLVRVPAFQKRRPRTMRPRHRPATAGLRSGSRRPPKRESLTGKPTGEPVGRHPDEESGASGECAATEATRSGGMAPCPTTTAPPGAADFPTLPAPGARTPTDPPAWSIRTTPTAPAGRGGRSRRGAAVG